MKKTLIGGLGIALFAGLASAGTIMEVESNDTYDTAQFLSGDLFSSNAVKINGSLSEGDVDFYSLDLNAGDFVTISVFDFTPDDGFDNDSFLGVFGPGGGLVDTDDDDGPGFLSAIAFSADSDGTWAFAVTGFGDTDFTGEHMEDFDYKVIVSVNPVPGPAVLATLGAAGLVAGRRRRRA